MPDSHAARPSHAISFQNNGADAANQLLNPQRHSPNRHVVKTMASLLDDPLYLSVFEDWTRQNAGIKLTDYLDEIEAEFDALEAVGAQNLIVTP